MRREGEEGERTKRTMASGPREEREEEAWEARAGSKGQGNERGMEMKGHRRRGLNSQRWSRRRRGGERERRRIRWLGKRRKTPTPWSNAGTRCIISERQKRSNKKRN